MKVICFYFIFATSFLIVKFNGLCERGIFLFFSEPANFNFVINKNNIKNIMISAHFKKI